MLQSLGALGRGKYLPEDALTGALFSLIRAFPFKMCLRSFLEDGVGIQGLRFDERSISVDLWPPIYLRAEQLVIPDAVIRAANKVIVVEAKHRDRFSDAQLQREERLAKQMARSNGSWCLLGISDHHERPAAFGVNGRHWISWPLAFSVATSAVGATGQPSQAHNDRIVVDALRVARRYGVSHFTGWQGIETPVLDDGDQLAWFPGFSPTSATAALRAVAVPNVPTAVLERWRPVPADMKKD